MIISLALKEMFKNAHLTYKAVAARLGVSYGAISSPIVRNNLKVDQLIRICDACGYTVILQPKVFGVSQGQIQMELSEEQKNKNN